METTPASPTAELHTTQAAAANTDFGFRLLAQLTKSKSGESASNQNVFFSPYSVSSALALALNGAGGPTQAAISRTLGLQGLTLDQANCANSQMRVSLTNPDPQVELSIANALWANQGILFAPDFQARCRTFYDARAATLDFHSPAAADTINAWVKDHTHGKIMRLVSAGALAGSPAVLTNAVYFHGQWTKQFRVEATQDGPFTRGDGTTKTLPLMTQTGSYAYAETPEFQAVSLPYGSGRVSLYVLLPKPGTEVGSLVSTLNSQSWQEDVSRMHPTLLSVVLPRFKVQYGSELSGPLAALGMSSAFGPGADFRPMGLQQGFIGQVIHKAVLEVNEEGTVAAAATGIVMRSLAIARPAHTMRIDHPFFGAIRDNTTGTLLFAGIIRDPQQ